MSEKYKVYKEPKYFGKALDARHKYLKKKSAYAKKNMKFNYSDYSNIRLLLKHLNSIFSELSLHSTVGFNKLTESQKDELFRFKEYVLQICEKYSNIYNINEQTDNEIKKETKAIEIKNKVIEDINKLLSSDKLLTDNDIDNMFENYSIDDTENYSIDENEEYSADDDENEESSPDDEDS